MKLPGTYAAYALIMGVFGQTPRGIHLGLLLANLATVALLSLSQGVYGVFARRDRRAIWWEAHSATRRR
jgi:hypothetical protein